MFAGTIRAATLVVVAGSLLTGCFGGGTRGGVDPGSRSRAALAQLFVENRTGRTLDVAFRYSVGPGGPVTVGSVPPRTTREMAPIPAYEPITLVATGADFRLELAPRTFDIDEVWTWVVRTDSTAHDR